jgi:hypothetical protein
MEHFEWIQMKIKRKGGPRSINDSEWKRLAFNQMRDAKSFDWDRI